MYWGSCSPCATYLLSTSAWYIDVPALAVLLSVWQATTDNKPRASPEHLSTMAANDDDTNCDQQPTLGKVRRKYTPQACIECQRRKRKCSGGRNCEGCRFSATECVYGRSRTSRRREYHQPSSTNRSSPPQALNIGHVQAMASLSPSTEDLHNDSAIRALQQGFQTLRDEVARLKSTPQDSPNTTTAPMQSPELIANMALSACPTMTDVQSTAPVEPPIVPSSSHLPPEQVLPPRATAKDVEMGCLQNNKSPEQHVGITPDSSFLRQFELLDRSINCREGRGDAFAPLSTEEPPGPDKDTELLASSLWQEADQMVEQMRAQDLDSMCRNVDIFFGHLHPHWPFINEINFRSQLAACWAKDTTFLKRTLMPKFAALLNFVAAAVQVLYPTSDKTTEVPGWNEFFRGEKLLTYTTWLEESNIMTVQILLVKTLYCYFAGHFDAAYDTVSIAVRLCFQLGLHDEPSWGPQCTFYERTYRQRVFWSLFCLSLLISHHAGVPDLMHKSSFDVEYPKQVDDRMLYPQCLPLQELPMASPVPHLLEVIKWARLSSEMWDMMFGVRAKNPLDPEIVMAMDEKVKTLSTQTPSFLQWTTVTTEDSDNYMLSFRWQQALVLYLRERSLRMFLRRYDMLSMRFDTQTAQTCIEIADEVIGAMELSRVSHFAQRTALYTLVLHLTGVIVPMICIIVRPGIDEGFIQGAIHAFNRSLRILKEYAPVQSFARRTLRQLDRPIRIASKTISYCWPQYAEPRELTPMSAELSSMVGDAVSAGLFPQSQSWDLFGQVLMPKATGTMTMDSSMHELTEDIMPWDDIFDARNTAGSWHAKHLVG